MATAYKISHEEEVSAKLCCCEKSEKSAPELSYPEPSNILATQPPTPQPTCE